MYTDLNFKLIYVILMEEELTLEKNLYNFIKEDELSFIQDPMNKKNVN